MDLANTDSATRTIPARQFGTDEYRLTAAATERARAAGLVNADWYKPSVARPLLKTLMQRSDAAALRDTLLWYTLIAASGVLAYFALGSAWAVPCFVLYGALYCGPADSRWHEAGHGTAFKTRWINDALYQVASFQVFRRPTVWRWSHARHHTDTLVVGRDPEIAAQVPTRWPVLIGNLVGLAHVAGEVRKLLLNVSGRLDAEEKTFVPESEWPRVIREARAWVVVYAGVFGLCWALGSFVPLLFVGLPSLYGAWLYLFFGLTQHAGLPENVTDHRKNCRTVYMNPVFRFLYWNMNYHVEHHMFPMVPYHALPRLHEALKSETPPAYRGTLAAYREIISALVRQTRDPGYSVARPLPR
jgi:fatty acid desaturase